MGCRWAVKVVSAQAEELERSDHSRSGSHVGMRDHGGPIKVGKRANNTFIPFIIKTVNEDKRRYRTIPYIYRTLSYVYRTVS